MDRKKHLKMWANDNKDFSVIARFFPIDNASEEDKQQLVQNLPPGDAFHYDHQIRVVILLPRLNSHNENHMDDTESHIDNGEGGCFMSR